MASAGQVSEGASGLAFAAQSAFTSARFDDAKRLLDEFANTLAPQSVTHLRVRYNEAILNFYHSGLSTDPLSLLQATVDMLPVELRPASTSSLEKVLNLLVSSKSVVAIREKSGFIPLFNVCVIAYQSSRVEQAAIIGSYLFEHVEAMEDWLALRTCCLLIDVNLRLGSASTVRRVMDYVETLVPTLNQSHASTDADGTARELDAVSQHMKVAPSQTGFKYSCLALPASLSDVKFCMHTYAARLSAAHEDVRSLKKEAKSAVSCSEDDSRCPTAAALVIKAKMESNATKVFRIMESIRSQATPQVFAAAKPLLLNNLGIVHHKIGCHAVAAAYLDLAWKSFNELFRDLGFPSKDGHATAYRPFSIIARSRDSHVTYNLALQHMQLGNFRTALSLFGICAKSDGILAKSSPILWIRMAECCVREACSGRESYFPAFVRGNGQARRFVLINAPEASVEAMRYAAVCARAAVELISLKKSSLSALNDSSAQQSSPLPRESMHASTQQKCHALSLLAYTCLHFDPSAALAASNELVTCSRLGDSNHAILGHIYGAEALCVLARPNEATDRLSPLLTMAGTTIAGGREGAFVNASLAHALQGDMAAAARAAKAALKVTASTSSNRSPRREAVQVAAYISSRDGNMEGARQLLQLSV